MGMHVLLSGLPDEDQNHGGVAEVVDVLTNGACDVKMVYCGTIVRAVAPWERTIVCSACHEEKLKFALPTLRCMGCDSLIKNNSSYYREIEMKTGVVLCRACFEALKSGDTPEALAEVELRSSAFEKLIWRAKEEEEYDHYVQCEGRCKRWYHYVCASFPDPDHLPASYDMQKKAFVCKACQADPGGYKHIGPLVELQTRRAAALPANGLSRMIESFLAAELSGRGITAQGITVRVVSQKKATYRAVAGTMQQRYESYPDEFPYVSKAVLAFQTIDGLDVCFFAMYVQEYGELCPQPNTNRTYISYLDSVRFLQTTPPESSELRTRSIVYHAIINGYLKQARSLGYTHAHIWVEPPKSGDEYIFHRRPLDVRHGTRPMSGGKLRSWYEQMLQRAQEVGIVREFGDIQEEIVDHLTSIRDLPMFEGDFFPEHVLRQVLPDEQAAASSSSCRVEPPTLGRMKSAYLLDQMKKQVRSVRRRFLVAVLEPLADLADSQSRISAQQLDEDVANNELVDSRTNFLKGCQDRHWQFDELRRAQYSTMMLLAHLGGKPAERACAEEPAGFLTDDPQPQPHFSFDGADELR